MSFDLPFLFILFSRCFGFFFLSPLFSTLPVPWLARFGLAAAMTCLLAPLTAHSQVTLGEGWLALSILKEMFFGYLLGMIFSLLLESAALAGQIVGVMSGFSATELLDPVTSSSHPLWSRLFVLFIGALLFAGDVHHGILKILFNSFSLFPLEGSVLHVGMLQIILEAVTNFFQVALEYAALPLFLLGFLILILAFVSKVLPEFPIFWMGFPLQIFIGILSLAIAVLFFSDIFQEAFLNTRLVIQRIFFELSKSV